MKYLGANATWTTMCDDRRDVGAKVKDSPLKGHGPYVLSTGSIQMAGHN
jgi:hypothetical protein